jgi:hypothetical protein
MSNATRSAAAAGRHASAVAAASAAPMRWNACHAEKNKAFLLSEELSP